MSTNQMKDSNHYHNYLNLTNKDAAKVREFIDKAYEIMFRVHPEECGYTIPMSSLNQTLHNIRFCDCWRPTIDLCRKQTGANEVARFDAPCDIWGQREERPYELVLRAEDGTLFKCTWYDEHDSPICEKI